MGVKKLAVCLVHREPFLFPFVAEESMEFIQKKEGGGKRDRRCLAQYQQVTSLMRLEQGLKGSC